MNILVPHSWLKEHLETKATPKQIAEYLSLCSQSVEKVIQTKNDSVYQIEVTTNRPDCLSIYGIAQELAAILPRFGLSAQLKSLDFEKISLPKVKKPLPLKVKIAKSSLCPRFTALIFDHIKVKPSPRVIQDRLEKSGIRALNNVVDISNYLMLELGQPMHTFDYDKVKDAKMILREAKKEEVITTLDGLKRPLPKGAIIIEDGQARIIDLCGLMGAENSAVDDQTKRVLLFVQTYDPQKIRQTCQKITFRTEAASRFEKGVNPEGVIPALERAIKMFQENCQAQIASDLIDIYPHPPKPKTVKLEPQLVSQIMGTKISPQEITNILESLGFKIQQSTISNQQLTIRIPRWRQDDISIPEDLIEEIARLYGYHHLPSYLMSTALPEDIPDPQFFWEKKIKELLSHWGFSEILSYSLQSENILNLAKLDPRRYLKLKNPLSQDLVYLRGSLIPSLLAVIAQNQAHFDQMKIFEIANIYLKSQKLPEEKPILCIAILGQNKFYQAKGIAETLLEILGIKAISYQPLAISNPLWHPAQTALVYSAHQFLGILGAIHPQILTNFEIKKPVVIINLDFALLTQLATTQKTYHPLPQFPALAEDLCFLVPPQTEVGELIQLIKDTSSIIKSVDLIDSFKNQRTFRITYQDPEKTLSDKEVEKIRKKIIKRLKDETQSRLKVAS